MTKKKITKIKKRNGLDPANVTKARRDYVDYDYTTQLSNEEKAWLERFTDEFYGADFKINDTYILENGEYVQISGNKDRSKNRDLRKHRSVTKYYKDENGDFSSDTNLKYDPETLHNTNDLRTECNRAANAIERNMFRSVRQNKGYSNINDVIDSMFINDDLNPESIILDIEYQNEVADILDKCKKEKARNKGSPK